MAEKKRPEPQRTLLSENLSDRRLGNEQETIQVKLYYPGTSEQPKDHSDD